MIDDIKQHISKLEISVYRISDGIIKHVYWKDMIKINLRKLLQEVNLFE